MHRVQYSADELRFVESRSSMNRRDLHAEFVEKFGRSDVALDHIRGLCDRKGWYFGRKEWTAADDALLRDLYPDLATTLVAKRMGRTVAAVYGHAEKLGLEKSAAYLESPAACRLRRGDNVGVAFRFQKGHAPANKGLRRPGFGPGRMKETQFKKGQATNWRPIGTEKVHVSPATRKRPSSRYWYTKISDIRGVPWTKNWKATHILRWEALHGSFDRRTHALKCRDGDTLNTDPSNWELIPRALLLLLNRRYNGGAFDTAPAEVKPAMMATAKLERATFDALKRTAPPARCQRGRQVQQGAR